MSISLHQPEGFRLCLETPRVVPDDANIFCTVQWGTLDHLRYLLQCGEASVLDTGYTDNKTVLHVRDSHWIIIPGLIKSLGSLTSTEMENGRIFNQSWCGQQSIFRWVVSGRIFINMLQVQC